VGSLAVLPNARGKGVGTKLLAWAEDVAKARNARVMTLSVINGNAAKKLYSRTGYNKFTKSDPCEAFCSCCFITVCFGRPYGLCHPECGGDDMEKPLVDGITMAKPMPPMSRA
jgi:hypothetical protein